MNFLEVFFRSTNSGVSEGLGRGPFIKMKRLLFHWHTGWGIPPIYIYIIISKNITTQTWSVNSGWYPSRSGGFSNSFPGWSPPKRINSTKTYQENRLKKNMKQKQPRRFETHGVKEKKHTLRIQVCPKKGMGLEPSILFLRGGLGS